MSVALVIFSLCSSIINLLKLRNKQLVKKAVPLKDAVLHFTADSKRHRTISKSVVFQRGKSLGQFEEEYVL